MPEREQGPTVSNDLRAFGQIEDRARARMRDSFDYEPVVAWFGQALREAYASGLKDGYVQGRHDQAVNEEHDPEHEPAGEPLFEVTIGGTFNVATKAAPLSPWVTFHIQVSPAGLTYYALDGADCAVVGENLAHWLHYYARRYFIENPDARWMSFAPRPTDEEDAAR